MSCGLCRRSQPWTSEIAPPSPKMSIATTSDQKYSSCPCPKGCAESAGRLLLRIPYRRSPPLPASTSEWIASESIAELPVAAAATNFEMAMARLPPTAARTEALFSPATLAARHENDHLRDCRLLAVL